MTEFNMAILSNWLISGYRFILYARKSENEATVRPLKDDISEDVLKKYQVPCYTLLIGDDLVKELAHGIILFDEGFPFTVYCDVSDIE